MAKNFTDGELQEIKSSYRNAKNAAAQVGILADLYTCAPSDIRAVLGLEPENPVQKRAPRSYDQEVKKQVVKAVLLEGRSMAAAAEAFGVPQSNVSVWVKKAKEQQHGYLDLPEKAQRTRTLKEEAAGTKLLRELREGVTGLRVFGERFDVVGFGTEDQRALLARTLAEAEVFIRGLETGLSLSEKRVSKGGI